MPIVKAACEHERRTVTELRPGDLVDLEGDGFADPQHDNPTYECEYQIVVGIERETAKCVRVDFESAPSVGFPPAHALPYGGHDPEYDA